MKKYSGKSRSERPKGFGKRRGSDKEKPMMHHATCNSCGKDCEVPFKPTSGKPIYCSSCFDRTENESPRKYSKERGDRKFRSGDSRKRSFDDRDSAVHSAVCDSCGKDCEVPFRPTKGKPIYCDKCFGNNKDQDIDQLKKEFGLLNKKLDEILEILKPAPTFKNYQKESEDELEDELKDELEDELEGELEDELEDEMEAPKLEQKVKKKVVAKKGKKKKL